MTTEAVRTDDFVQTPPDSPYEHQVFRKVCGSDKPIADPDGSPKVFIRPVHDGD